MANGVDPVGVAVAALAPTSRGQGVRENGTISGSAAIDRMIEQAAAENGVPRELAFAVVHVESRYNPKAKGAGVYGLSQIMPATARSLGFSGPVEALYDPATNLRYGMKYLKGAWEKGGRDICQASMKYKGGHRATRMTKSAAAYCSNVKRHIASITGRPVAEPVQVASLPETATAPSIRTQLPSGATTAMAPVPTLPGVSAVQAIAASAQAPDVSVEATAPAQPDPGVTTAAVEASGGKAGRPTGAKPVLTAAVAADAADAPDPSRFGD